MNISHLSIQWITGIVCTIISGVVLWRITKPKWKLNYYLSETDSFDSESGYVKYYAIKLANVGNRMIEAIDVDISFSDGKIGKITDHKAIKEMKKTESNLSFSVNLLNSKDDINFIITVLESKKGTSRPQINIIGKGATAKDKSSSQNSSDRAVGSFAGGILCGILFTYGLIYLETPSPDVSPDKIEKIFFALNKAGVPQVFPEVMTIDDNMSYVGTSFHLTHCYLRDTINGEKYINALKSLSQLSDIAPTSKGVIFYLIYKIRKKENNLIEANEYLQKCKTETPIMYEKLMEHDSYYNLDNLQVLLRKNNL